MIFFKAGEKENKRETGQNDLQLTRREGLLDFVRLGLIRNNQGVQVARASDFELRDPVRLVDLASWNKHSLQYHDDHQKTYTFGIFAMSLEEKILHLSNLFRLRR